MPPSNNDKLENLDARMLAAHGDNDLVSLIGLYTLAANMSEARGDIDAACFYLAQAYVFALDTGAPAARTVHARLKVHGRER